jgi:hypothetical protein
MTISHLPPLALTGTLPIKPFGEQFYGTISADGQQPNVAALACTPGGEVLALSLVGYDTSVSAALSRLYAGKGLSFQPDTETPWTGPRQLLRLASPYRQYTSALTGTRERHYVTLTRLADIGAGLLHPPTIPEDPKAEEGTEGQVPAPANKEPPAPRYVLGNGDETTPERLAFLGHLRALRVIHLPTWADTLWTAGLDQHLIVPQLALGIQCWRLEGDLQRWSALLTQGVRQGWLRPPEQR